MTSQKPTVAVAAGPVVGPAPDVNGGSTHPAQGPLFAPPPVCDLGLDYCILCGQEREFEHSRMSRTQSTQSDSVVL